MLVNFTKMHGLGNDFVVIDLITQPIKLSAAQIKRIADRHLGIGCDQLLLIEPPTRSKADFYYRIFNSNGQEVEQCGNGIRCAARFFYDMGFTHNTTLEADCLAGRIKCMIETNGEVSIDMGKPIFNPPEIPFTATKTALTYPISIDNTEILMSVISMGNPHAIIQVQHGEEAYLKKIGPLLSKHSSFPKETNVGFMQVVDRNQIHLRVYERHVGETKACGTAACAAAVAGIRLGLLDSPVSVNFATGQLNISWKGVQQPVYMIGPVSTVFVGRFRL